MGQSSPSVYSPVMQKWKERLLDQMVLVPSTGRQEPPEIPEKEMQSPAPGECPMLLSAQEAGQQESSLVETYLGILVTTKWNVIQKCALVTKKTNNIQTVSVKRLPVDQGSWSFPSTQHWLDHIRDTVSGSEHFGQENYGHSGAS